MKGFIVSVISAAFGVAAVFFTMSDSSNTDIVNSNEDIVKVNSDVLKNINEINKSLKKDSSLNDLSEIKYKLALEDIKSIYDEAYQGQLKRGLSILPAPLKRGEGEKIKQGETLTFNLSNGSSANISVQELWTNYAIVRVNGKETTPYVGDPINIDGYPECKFIIAEINVQENPRYIKVRAECSATEDKSK